MSLMGNIAFYTLELIQKQIDEGIDMEGKKYQYSTKPFWRPYNPKIVEKLGGKRAQGSTYNIVTNKNGKKGIIVKGGYKSYKILVHPISADSYLTATGNLRQAMTVANIDDTNMVAELGFSDNEAAQLAFYLTRSGVGKSRKLWKFWGLNEKNMGLLLEYVGNLLGKSIIIKDGVMQIVD